jgi:hypothetical protein
MLNSAILIKVKQRLNKLASNDFDNIQPWQIIEAFDKGTVDWCRRNLHGLNIVKEGDEQSTRRVDDFQVLLTTTGKDSVPALNMENKIFYYEADLPADYLQWKRISTEATSECCPKPKRMIVYPAEVANRDILLRDKNKQPSYEWGETFSTLENNKLQVYTNKLFTPVNTQLVYYRQPRKIQIINVTNPYTGIPSAVNVESEFKDDIIELLIDEAVKILAGDIEAINQIQRESQAVENNN